MFIDEAEIVVKGGDGGNGKVAFYANRSGTSGGDGGRGGRVVFILSNNVTTLKKYTEKTVFKAENGIPGGSKNGLNKIFLELADPLLAVISVGKNNSYGHPSKKVLDMLKAKNIKILRTDVDGDIVFKIKD